MNVSNLSKLAVSILIPGWIMIFGLAFPQFPTLGVAGSLGLCVLGIVVIPAMASLFRGAAPAVVPLESANRVPLRHRDRGVDRPDTSAPNPR